jgi:hypothetical protein
MSSQNPNPGVHQTTWKQPAGNETVDATQADMVKADRVEGENILFDRSSADEVRGDRVTLKQSKASTVQASSVQMDKSAAVAIDSENLVMQDSAAAFVEAGTTRMVKSRAVLLQSEETVMEDGSQAVLVITGGLTGEARALVTVPAAAVVGAVLAIIGVLLFAVIQGSRK